MCAVSPRGRLRRILARVSPTPVASPGQGFQPVDPTKAFSLWTPAEGPCPCDPREGRAALAHPAPPCADGMRALPGACVMSRSKKRKRTEIIHARVTKAEKADVAAKAKAAGGISALFRNAVLGYKPPKSKVDTQAVVKLLAELGKIGSNVN